MSENILNDWLGLDLVELKKVSETTKEKRKEIAISIVRLTESEDWKTFEAELDRMLEEITKPCEVYAQNPDMAKYDSGMKRTLTLIKNFINNQPKILEEYVKKQKAV